jgi:hypothetical protein
MQMPSKSDNIRSFIAGKLFSEHSEGLLTAATRGTSDSTEHLNAPAQYHACDSTRMQSASSSTRLSLMTQIFAAAFAFWASAQILLLFVPNTAAKLAKFLILPTAQF